jgi:hypothetical protein
MNSLQCTGCMWFLSHKCCNRGDNFCRGIQIWKSWHCNQSYKGRSDLKEAVCRRCSKIYLKACMIGNHSDSQAPAQGATQIWKSFRRATHLDNYRAWNIYSTSCKRYYLSLNWRVEWLWNLCNCNWTRIHLHLIYIFQYTRLLHWFYQP